MDDYNHIDDFPPEKSNFSIWVIRITALLTLFVFAAAALRFNRDDANLQVLRILDTTNDSMINAVEITVLPAERAKQELERENYIDVIPPIDIPLKGGRCSTILVYAQRYHEWKETFCPVYSERIYIEIGLVPKRLPPPQPVDMET